MDRKRVLNTSLGHPHNLAANGPVRYPLAAPLAVLNQVFLS